MNNWLGDSFLRKLEELLTELTLGLQKNYGYSTEICLSQKYVVHNIYRHLNV